MNCRRSSNQDVLDVLLVDDDHNDLAFFGLAINKAEVNIWLQTANDGEQAMSYLEGQGTYADRAMHPLPAVLVLDLKMPGMSGLEFLAWLKASPEFCGLPTIIFSGSEDKREIRRALELGAELHIAKPFDFEDWKAAVRQVRDFGMQRRLKARARRSELEPVRTGVR